MLILVTYCMCRKCGALGLQPHIVEWFLTHLKNRGFQSQVIRLQACTDHLEEAEAFHQASFVALAAHRWRY